jgi:hypothetical protein
MLRDYAVPILGRLPIDQFAPKALSGKELRSVEVWGIDMMLILSDSKLREHGV